MNQSASTYDVIAGHNADVQAKLYTPAHQGRVHAGAYLSQEMYQYDVPFLTRPRTEHVEKHFSQLYGTHHTFWLTGGGSQGVLTACALLGTQYKRVAIALNSHISTINGIILAGLEPYFIPSVALMPTISEVIEALENSQVSALLLTHPSAVSILEAKAVQEPFPCDYFSRRPQMKILPNQAFFGQKEKLSLDQALGRISGSCIKKKSTR